MPQPPPLKPPPRMSRDSTARHARGESSRRGPRGWVLALMTTLVVGLIAVFAVLPRVVADPETAPAPAPAPDAIETPAPALPTVIAEPEATVVPADEGLSRTVDSALAEGRAALAERDPQTAVTAFSRAAALDPGNRAADSGLERAETLAEVVALEGRAVAAENRGDWDEAAETAGRALDLDPASRTARGVSNRVAARMANESYRALVTRGLTALENDRYESALAAFTAAGERRPGAPEVSDGIARARAGLQRRSVAEALDRASAAEDAEDWQRAVREYRAVLALDPDLAAAEEGLERSEERLDLVRRIVFHLENPDRLATEEVLAEAADLADEAGSISPTGPALDELVRSLEALVARASTPVLVTLRSDGKTEITLYPVGPLGTFDSRTLDLRPGVYTAVGRRPGYRDVRVELRIGPDAPAEPIAILCTERI